MKLNEIISALEGALVSQKVDLDPELEIRQVCAADLMSDVLAFAEPESILVTGLCNPQVVCTADMADIVGIVFVRGKIPPPETIALAEEERIPLISTPHPMFEACGRLYQAGLKSIDIES
jgi:hypothetical protein